MRFVTIALAADDVMSAQLTALLFAGDEIVAMVGYIDRIVLAVQNKNLSLRTDPKLRGVVFPAPSVDLPPVVLPPVDLPPIVEALS